MERETRIELATNSLEGCDSTIELLPLSLVQLFTLYHGRVDRIGLNRESFEARLMSCLRTFDAARFQLAENTGVPAQMSQTFRQRNTGLELGVTQLITYAICRLHHFAL